MTEKLTFSPEEIPGLYEPIDLPQTGPDEAQAAMDAYERFVRELDLTTKRKFHFIDQQHERTGESGYVYKENIDPTSHEARDRKHVFHYTPELRRIITGMPSREVPEAVKQLTIVAEEIYHDLARAVKGKFQEWSADAPWLVGVHFPADGTLDNHLRFLAYELGDGGKLAEGHYDKSVATVAVCESKGGLRLGVGEHDLQMLNREQFRPVIFRGYGWHQLHEIMDVPTPHKAAWHDVINLPEDPSDKPDLLRLSMVYFVNPAKLHLNSTNEQTHTPVRWRNTERASLPIDGSSFLA